MNDDYALKDPQREYRLFFGRLGFTVLVVMLMVGGLRSTMDMKKLRAASIFGDVR